VNQASGPHRQLTASANLLRFQEVRGTEAIWMKFIGVLLILLGLTMLASVEIILYTTNENISGTRYSTKRERILVVPRTAAVLVLGAGVATLIIVVRK